MNKYDIFTKCLGEIGLNDIQLEAVQALASVCFEQVMPGCKADKKTVMNLQQLINKAGVKIAVDGAYGPKTSRAAREVMKNPNVSDDIKQQVKACMGKVRGLVTANISNGNNATARAGQTIAGMGQKVADAIPNKLV